MPTYTYTLFHGTFIHLPRSPSPASSPSDPDTDTDPGSKHKPKHAFSIHHGVLWVSVADGRIGGCEWGVKRGELERWVERRGWVWTRRDDRDDGGDGGDGDGEEGGVVTVRVVCAREERNEFFFPGFVDTHIHASQYPNTGLFGSSTLLDWLETYTFPLENSFSNTKTARTAYSRIISRTLANGTTCAAYYATIHVPATNLLASLCLRHGQRAFVGRVCMDDPRFCPSYYRDASPEESVAATEATVKHIRGIDPEGTLVAPIVTPRFAPTCTTTALAKLGELAASGGGGGGAAAAGDEGKKPLRIQTHISENRNEVSLVRDLFPDSPTYAAVYDRYNLLTPRTILAHAVHLTPPERALIRARGSKISHCPASNSALGSGLCPVRTLLDDGITVGLGTDVSGGYSPSMLESVRQACLVSRMVSSAAEQHKTGRESLSVEEALYLATRGGAECVDLADRIGGFDVGMCFDAQLIALGKVQSPATTPTDGDDDDGDLDDDDGDDGSIGNVDIFGWESWEEKIHKWVWSGDDRNVKAVWVNGRLVHRRK